jgi:methylenetetrahydrofolate dehydrogenase (NADP+)/methenyltetrahydrofolate cyclohydrolase
MLIDGKKIAEEIQAELKTKIQGITGRKPGLAVILVGDNPASQLYVNRKAQACEEIGMHSIKRLFPSSITETELLKEVENLNRNDDIDGILIQLPLPPQINSTRVMRSIDPSKDVDGFHPINVGKLMIGDTDGFVPCTPLGIKALLNRSKIELSGKHVVILGRSNIVGKPLAALLMQNTQDANATVTVLHSKSKNIPEICRTADIIVAAMGQPKFITKDMVKPGAVIIDVGTNRIANPSKKSGFELAGDVDFHHVKEICAWITPVPGGVGPMTIAMLLSNTWSSYQRRHKV